MDDRRVASELWGPTVAVLDAAAARRDVLDVALDELCRVLGADRADAGMVPSCAAAYVPAWQVAPGGQTATFAVAGGDAVIAGVLASELAVTVADVEHEMALGSCRDAMLRIGTRSVLARRFEAAGTPGLICFDWTTTAHHADDDELELVDQFCRDVLEPVLHLAAVDARGKSPPPIELLTPGERQVVRLAAAGLSYRQIAAELDRSVSTIDHQLLSARRRVGARNTAQLVRLLGVDDG